MDGCARVSVRREAGDRRLEAGGGRPTRDREAEGGRIASFVMGLGTARQLLLLLARGKWFLLPFVVILLFASLVLIGTQTMPWLAPFVYVAF